ncbi:MAG: hypothetical protein V3S82_07675 [Dehalococcoidia bacterium]
MAAVNRIVRLDLLAHGKEIAREYYGILTLRQLYYQCVARGHSPNSQKDYNRLKDIISEARMAGAFPFDWLIDRSRTVHSGAYNHRSADVADALENAAQAVANTPYWYLSAAKWWGQKTHVSVWVEKEALAGVFEGPCQRLGVSWFACKGYPSLSSLWAWVKQVETTVVAAEADGWGGLDKIVIVYFGDHDPDGYQIHKTALRTVREIAGLEGIDLPPITLERAALNRAQIEQYNPPPMPAKKSSPRFVRYAADHPWTKGADGKERAWELDALRPEQLDKLIRTKVAAHYDRPRHDEVQAVIEERRVEMRAEMKAGGWLQDALDRIADGE